MVEWNQKIIVYFQPNSLCNSIARDFIFHVLFRSFFLDFILDATSQTRFSTSRYHIQLATPLKLAFEKKNFAFEKRSRSRATTLRVTHRLRLFLW